MKHFDKMGNKYTVEANTYHKDVVNYIRLLRSGWFGHINRIQEHRLVKRIYEWESIN